MATFATRAGIAFLGTIVLATCLVGDAYAGRDQMQGEVDESDAYVQTFSSEGSSSSAEIKAQIKIRTTGSYAIVGGFFKGKCFHRGWLSGQNYFDTTRVSGDAGDVITVTLRAPRPPMNRNITVGVFTSTSSICTSG